MVCCVAVVIIIRESCVSEIEGGRWRRGLCDDYDELVGSDIA